MDAIMATLSPEDQAETTNLDDSVISRVVTIKTGNTYLTRRYFFDKDSRKCFLDVVKPRGRKAMIEFVEYGDRNDEKVADRFWKTYFEPYTIDIKLKDIRQPIRICFTLCQIRVKEMRQIPGIFFLFIALLGPRSIGAQAFSYPELPARGSSPDGFIPGGWFLKDSASGDLNGDRLPDLALVLEYRDTIPELLPDSTVNKGSPRILAVLLKNPRSGSYDLFLQNNTFIPRYRTGGMDPEAYGEIRISKGILQVFLSFIRGHATYKFRMQQGDLYLIGGTTAGVAGGIYYGFDANFSTGKAKMEEGRIDEVRTREKWIKLPAGPLKKLRDLNMIFQWEVVNGQYL